jgi:hypothetical protein
MKRTLLLIAVASAFAILGSAGASARVELGAPDFPNYLSPPGRGTCDWWRSAWLRACPGAVVPAAEVPAAAAPAAAPAPAAAAVKGKNGGASKPAQ